MVELIAQIRTPVARGRVDGDREHRPPIGHRGQLLAVGGEGDGGALGLQAEGVEGRDIGGEPVGDLRALGHILVGADAEQAGDGGRADRLVKVGRAVLVVAHRQIAAGNTGHIVLFQRRRNRRRLHKGHRHVVLHTHRDQTSQVRARRIAVIVGDTHLHILPQVSDRQQGVITRASRVI